MSVTTPAAAKESFGPWTVGKETNIVDALTLARFKRLYPEAKCTGVHGGQRSRRRSQQEMQIGPGARVASLSNVKPCVDNGSGHSVFAFAFLFLVPSFWCRRSYL
jgi:hypothetical protein